MAVTRASKVARGLIATAHSMHLDGVGAEVVLALRARGIETVLLKGPALGRWLYPDGGGTPYVDIDLLTAPGTLRQAEETLAGLGFERRRPRAFFEPMPAELLPAQAWTRSSDLAEVDLHRSLDGVGCSDRQLWKELQRDAVPIRVAGVEMRTPGPTAQVMHVALHAAHHGVGRAKPMADLAQALEQVPEGEWLAAARLAARLDATEAFASGLRLLPPGADIAERLGLSRPRSVEIALKATTPPPLALGFHKLASTPTFRSKLSLVGRKIIPSPAFMRAWSGLARRGPLGLIAAYAWRPLYLAGHSFRGLAAWMAARREVKTEPESG